MQETEHLFYYDFDRHQEIIYEDSELISVMLTNLHYDIQIVKHHSQETGLQRRVFVDFFCNPERLRSQVRELTARIRALQIS